jgi:hypothetical protein
MDRQQADYFWGYIWGYNFFRYPTSRIKQRFSVPITVPACSIPACKSTCGSTDKSAPFIGAFLCPDFLRINMRRGCHVNVFAAHRMY